MGLLESITSAVIYGRSLSDLLTLALIRLCKQFLKALFSFQTRFAADVSQRSQHCEAADRRNHKATHWKR